MEPLEWLPNLLQVGIRGQASDLGGPDVDPGHEGGSRRGDHPLSPLPSASMRSGSALSLPLPRGLPVECVRAGCVLTGV